jgi:hypothetical protein
MQMGPDADDELPEREQSPDNVSTSAKLNHVATSSHGGFWLSSVKVGSCHSFLLLVHMRVIRHTRDLHAVWTKCMLRGTLSHDPSSTLQFSMLQTHCNPWFHRL